MSHPIGNIFRRVDRTWALVEGMITVFVLILMVLVAGFQALIRNLTRWDIEWASRILFDIEWADSLLRKGTLWLAFLGASLATYYGRHIGIDVLMRIAPAKIQYVMRGLSNVSASAITFCLVISFSSAVSLNLTERPLEYEVLGEYGAMHVCDAEDTHLVQLQMEKPTLFCGLRAGLSLLSVHAETAGAAFQLIVPIMFVLIGIRLFGRGLASFMILLGGATAVAAAQAEEAKRAAASVTALYDNTCDNETYDADHIQLHDAIAHGVDKLDDR